MCERERTSAIQKSNLGSRQISRIALIVWIQDFLFCLIKVMFEVWGLHSDFGRIERV